MDINTEELQDTFSQNFSEAEINLNDSDCCTLSSTSSCLLNSPLTSPSISKWKLTKYSRWERRCRKREGCSETNFLVTDYYPIIEKIENALKETNQMDIFINNLNRFSSPNQVYPRVYPEVYPNAYPRQYSVIQKNRNTIPKLLEMLLNAHKTGKKDADLKQLATYTYLIGGRLLYDTMYANLKGALPSLRLVQQYISECNETQEGVFNIQGLKRFLLKRNLPLKIWISEDGTAITGM